MLVEFKVENFRSFNDEQVLSFVASEDERLSGLIQREDVTGRGGLNLLPSLYVYGANASGKSNLCEAVRTFRRIVVESATQLNEGDSLPGVTSFHLKDDKRAAEPTTFESTQVIGGDLYRYGFATTSSRIDREWLFVRRQGVRPREVMLLQREGPNSRQWDFSNAIAWPTEILRERTRPSNGLVLSKAAQENVASVLPLYRALLNQLLVIDLACDPLEKIKQTLEACFDDKDFHVFLSRIAKAADVGISEITIIEEAIDPWEGLPVEVPPKLREQARSITLKRLRTLRRSADGTNTIFGFGQESSGTQRFLVVASILYRAWQDRQTVFIDEIESSLHPLLVQTVQMLVNDPDFSALGAQFVFATHDTNLLDQDRMRRDQIVLAEKGLHGETRLSSLYDSPDRPRPDAALERQYLNGKFGGVPVLGNLRDAFLDAMYPQKAER